MKSAALMNWRILGRITHTSRTSRPDGVIDLGMACRKRPCVCQRFSLPAHGSSRIAGSDVVKSDRRALPSGRLAGSRESGVGGRGSGVERIVGQRGRRTAFSKNNPAELLSLLGGFSLLSKPAASGEGGPRE